MARAVLALWVPMAVGFATGRRELALLPAMGGLLSITIDNGGPLLVAGGADRHGGGPRRGSRAVYRDADPRARVGRGARHRRDRRGIGHPGAARRARVGDGAAAHPLQRARARAARRAAAVVAHGAAVPGGGGLGPVADHARVPALAQVGGAEGGRRGLLRARPGPAADRHPRRGRGADGPHGRAERRLRRGADYARLGGRAFAAEHAPDRRAQHEPPVRRGGRGAAGDRGAGAAAGHRGDRPVR